MGGVTPIYGFPYPTGSDRVADGDNAIQALAERVELKLGPAGDAAPLAFYGCADVYQGTRVYRRAGMATLNLNIGFTMVTNPGSGLLQLPVGFRPAATVVRFVTWRELDGDYEFQVLGVGSDGYVRSEKSSNFVPCNLLGTVTYALPMA